jgi:hypothetical protein
VIRHSSLVLGAIALLGSAAPAAAQTGNAGSGTAFNPKISLILNGTYADYSSDAEPDVGGVVLGPETEFRPAGLSLGESELVVESNVDTLFHAKAVVALENEDGETVVAVEEAFADTLSLPAGLALKFGRFKSEIGYQNHIHAHAWEFVDAPIVYRSLLATQLADDGVQVRWVAPLDLFVELGGEALRGQGFPGGGDARNGVNGYTGFVHVGGDVGIGGSWRVGLSHLKADADARASGEDVTTLFTGDSDVSIVDLVFKWAEDGNPGKRNVVFNAEYFHREETGDLEFDPDLVVPDNQLSAYDGTQDGYYAQVVYQFVPRWRAGVRYDWLTADNRVANPAPGTTLATLADASYEPQRLSAMIDFSNSEFSRIRVQYNRDESRPGDEEDDQVFLQYILSIGAHAAHQF